MLYEHTVNDRCLRLECSSRFAPAVVHVFEAFERLPEARNGLQAGVQLRFGWSLLHLIEDGDALRIAEPDFSQWPLLRWNSSLDTTLEVLSAQVSLIRKLRVVGVDAYLDQVVLMSEGTLDDPEVFLQRDSSLSEADSGWTLSPFPPSDTSSGDAELQAVTIASLAARRPSLLQVLTLPIGYIAIFSGDSLEQVFDDSGRTCFPQGPDTPFSPSH
jgi:hypothetical protein